MGFYIAEIDKDKPRNAKEERPPRLRLSSASYRAACQSNAPQAVIKVASYVRGTSVLRTMNYIARDGDQELESESGEIIRGKDAIKDRFTNWRQDFEPGAPGTKRPPRHATHMILSAKCENTAQNVRRLEAAARQFLHDRYGKQGYEYVWTIHRDTENPHVHVLVKNHNRELGKKLRIDKADLMAMREEFAKQLTLRGIEQVATRRMDRQSVVERVAKGLESARKDRDWFRATLEKVEQKHFTNGVHAGNWLTRQVKQAERLKRLLERDVSALSPTRADLLREIKQAKKETLALASEKPGIAARATVQRIAADFKKYSKELAALRPNDKAEAGTGAASSRAKLEERRKREAALEKWWAQQRTDIAAAREYITKTVNDPGERRDALSQLTQYQKNLERAVVRDQARER